MGMFGLAVLVPSLFQGFDAIGPTKLEMGLLSYVRAYSGFIIELSPYYFLYPLLVGGIRFPGWVSNRKVSLSWPTGLASSLIGVVGFVSVSRYIDISTVDKVNNITGHAPWRSKLTATVNPNGRWVLGNAIGEYMDLYYGAYAGVLIVFAAVICPSTPTVFSLLGTRVIGAYLTLPLTLIAAGHFIGPALLDADGPWKYVQVQFGMIVLLVLIVALTAQPLPGWILRWATQTNTELAASKIAK